MKVLITGGRAPACLELARSFHALGHTVVAADVPAFPLTRGSRAVSRYLRVPSPRLDLAGFLQRVDAERADLVIPTCEEVFYLAAGGVRNLVASPFELLHSLHHKGRFAALHRWSPQAGPGDEVVCKPAYSRFGTSALLKPDAATREGLRGEWVTQRFVEGTELCTYSLAVEGQLRAHACYRPAVRAGRASSVVFLAQDHPGVEALVAELVGKLGYTGQLGLDLIEDPEGRLWVLECNPRATSGIHLLAGPELARAFLEPGPLLRGLRSCQLRLAATLCAPRAAWACRHLPDVLGPRATARLPLMVLETLVSAMRTGQSLKDAATADIEWNGEPLNGRSRQRGATTDGQ